MRREVYKTVSIALLHAVTAGASLYIKPENLIASKAEYALSN